MEDLYKFIMQLVRTWVGLVVIFGSLWFYFVLVCYPLWHGISTLGYEGNLALVATLTEQLEKPLGQRSREASFLRMLTPEMQAKMGRNRDDRFIDGEKVCTIAFTNKQSLQMVSYSEKSWCEAHIKTLLDAVRAKPPMSTWESTTDFGSHHGLLHRLFYKSVEYVLTFALICIVHIPIYLLVVSYLGKSSNSTVAASLALAPLLVLGICDIASKELKSGDAQWFTSGEVPVKVEWRSCTSARKSDDIAGDYILYTHNIFGRVENPRGLFQAPSKCVK